MEPKEFKRQNLMHLTHPSEVEPVLGHSGFSQGCLGVGHCRHLLSWFVAVGLEPLGWSHASWCVAIRPPRRRQVPGTTVKETPPSDITTVRPRMVGVPPEIARTPP